MKSLFDAGSNRIILLLFLALALYASYLLVAPFLQSIVLAILIGMLAYPVHSRILTLLKGRRSSAALLSCLLLFLVGLIPFTLLLVAVLKQGINYSIVLREWATEENIHQLLAQPWMLSVRARLEQILPPGALDPDNIRSQAVLAAGQMGRRFASVSTSLVGSVTSFMINIVLLQFVLFFVLRDYDGLVAFIHRALPLSRSQEEVLFEEVKAVSKSALTGSLLTAMTQGIVGGIGFWMVGIPALFWGFMMAFASMIPVVGTALIWLPAAIYLAVTDQMGWALFMVAWGVIVVGSVDNFLRPMFMQGATMNTVVVFFSLIGGLQVFGLIGLIYGPVIFAVTLVLFKLYETEFAGFLKAQDGR